MKNSLSFLVLFAFSLVLILVVIAYYLFSKIAASTKPEEGAVVSGGTDSLRKHGVNDLASKISYLSGDTKISWPTEWQQIGTSATECQLKTTHCQVVTDTCFDLQKLTNNKFKLPVDSSQGSEGKTGYAIRSLNGKIEIIACFAESSLPINQEIKI